MSTVSRSGPGGVSVGSTRFEAAAHHLLPTAADAAGLPRPFLHLTAEMP